MTKKKNGCWTTTTRPLAACSASVEVTLGQPATAAVVVAMFGSSAAGSAPSVLDGGGIDPSSVAAPQPTASAKPHAVDNILALIVSPSCAAGSRHQPPLPRRSLCVGRSGFPDHLLTGTDIARAESRRARANGG